MTSSDAMLVARLCFVLGWVVLLTHYAPWAAPIIGIGAVVVAVWLTGLAVWRDMGNDR